MKKVIISYFIYLVIIWGYFIYFYPLETLADSNYGALAHAVYFSKLPLEWILLYALIKQDWSSRWVRFIEKFTKWEWIRTACYAFLLVFFYGLIRFPFNLLWFRITHSEGTSHQPANDWLFEMGLDLLFYWIVLSIGIYLGRMILAKFKRMWWFVVWLLALPIALFVVYIQPVWIDPLYEDFTEMEEGPLRTAIEDFTTSVGLEDATLLQVNMSEKVTTFNAYVTGIMGNARIVMWDTTLEGMEQEEILFILAHEIGHYVKHHVYLGVVGYLVLSFVLLFIAAQIYKRITQTKRFQQKFHSIHDLRAVPILLLILSLLLTLSQPVSMYVSRQIELSADAYAIEHTANLEPAIEGYQRMAKQSKGDIDPVFWVKAFRFSHPPMKDRIEMVKDEIEKREKKTPFSP
ncbi:M48 family metalloprotease [Aquibacillus sediminis]|uniref:M48 family metalloprotease n=1 Tax=Aquibacillus sediminis TaxID=2574734 RepID=UPI001485C558|nr:M48 family metalloprotease [Aquibacillus sediminis]